MVVLAIPKSPSTTNLIKQNTNRPTKSPIPNSAPCRIRSRLWAPFLICVALLFIADIFQMHTYTISEHILNRIPVIITNTTHDIEEILILRREPDVMLLNDANSKQYLIKTPGCHIPYMDPFDPSVKHTIQSEKEPICNHNIPPLFESNLTSIYLLSDSIDHYLPTGGSSNGADGDDNNNVNEDGDVLECCVRVFRRRDTKNNEIDDKIEYDPECVPIDLSNQNGTRITAEFIKVTCSVAGKLVYTDFFSFIPYKNTTQTPFSANYPTQSPLNVLIVGIDAVSRVNFHRQMPKTVRFLKENLKAAEFFGYNKVADNTFPNLIPVLTGFSENELENVCWKKTKKFDDCPFIWNRFRNAGYVTSFGEDASWMGIFNYMRHGFRKQPTDYMWGAFDRLATHEIGNVKSMNVEECYGSRIVYRVFLEYIARFVERMDDALLPYFAFYWGASLTHDLLNKPKLGDVDYRNFFQRLLDGNHLNSTALIVMSDHGMRWGAIRETYQGRLEERLPFLFAVLPEWYKSTYPNLWRNLVGNTERLTTPYDLHETLKDLLEPFNVTVRRGGDGPQRGVSLFNAINANRTCSDAGINDHWCTCQQSSSVNVTDRRVVKAANFAVGHMNTMLVGYGQCANLTLDQVLDARILTHGSEVLLAKSGQSDYMVTLRTKPGDGLFEATVRYKQLRKEQIEISVIGTISRLNLYGKQSSCIMDFHLKLYCFCMNFLTF